MLAVQVTSFGESPKPCSLPRPDIPTSPDQILLRVVAVGLHNVVKSRASGQHYSSLPLPHTPGVDGVGYEIVQGGGAEKKYFYFSSLSVGKGSYTEYIVLPRTVAFELPEGVDLVQCAALVNPVMSSWMALKGRVDFLKDEPPKEGFEALVVGATTMSGRLAVRVARHFGATKVFGAARDESKLKSVQGLDGHVILNDDSPQSTDFSVAKGASVVLDYLYGPWPGVVLKSLRDAGATHPLTWVNIGSLAGEGQAIPSAELRSRDVSIRGSGIGSWDPRRLSGETHGMLEVLQGVKEDSVKAFEIKDVEAGWKHRGDRVVFTFEN